MFVAVSFLSPLLLSPFLTLSPVVHRLIQRGLLHKTLLPFIWNGIAGMSSKQAANEDEFRKLIALLQAFDILMDKPILTGEEVSRINIFLYVCRIKLSVYPVRFLPPSSPSLLSPSVTDAHPHPYRWAPSGWFRLFQREGTRARSMLR
jgi:hypothetical protein